MSSPGTPWEAVFSAELWPLGLCVARLGPIALLSPVLGGPGTAPTVRLSLVLAIAFSLRALGAVTPASDGLRGSWMMVVRELGVGTAIGLAACLPFEAARMAGRFIDTFRGASAEVIQPVTGTREATTEVFLYRLTIALASSLTLPQLMVTLCRSFVWLPVGTLAPSEPWAVMVAKLVGISFATGLAVAAPVAVVCYGVDIALVIASRAAPQLSLPEVAAPIRLLAGAAVTCAGLGILSHALLASSGSASLWLETLVRGGA